MNKDSVWHKHIFANTRTKTIFLIILSAIMIGLAILVWANQTGKISLWAAGVGAPEITNITTDCIMGYKRDLIKWDGHAGGGSATYNIYKSDGTLMKAGIICTTCGQQFENLPLSSKNTYYVKRLTGLGSPIRSLDKTAPACSSTPTTTTTPTITPQCTPGQKKCEGDKPAVCASNGTWSVARTGCSLSGQTCVNGECVGSPTPPTTTTPAPPSGECTTGEAKCTTSILRTFCYSSPVGNIWQSEYCGTGQTCTNGTCSGTISSTEVNPKVTGDCQGPITVTWNPIAKATHFIVRSQDENGTWAQYEAVRDGSTSFTIKGFTNKITKVEVAAWSNFTESKLAEGTVNVPCGEPEPQNLKITTTGDCNGPVTASWNAIANSTHYTFEWQTVDEAWALYGNPITATSHTINNNEWDSSLPVEKRQVVTVRATAYNEATGQQLAQGTANIGCDDPVKELCDVKCKSLGYASGACTGYPVVPEYGMNPCKDNGGVSISGVSECDYSECPEIMPNPPVPYPCIGMGMATTCCCSKKTEPEPTPTPTPTETNYITQLVSTGASLWVNIFFALLLVAGIGLYIFRDEIHNRSKK